MTATVKPSRFSLGRLAPGVLLMVASANLAFPQYDSALNWIGVCWACATFLHMAWNQAKSFHAKSKHASPKFIFSLSFDQRPAQPTKDD
tara:strand:+ start:4391 stop:4657 length:267 start_codon:yes stop_codon:yes gene_type:complete